MLTETDREAAAELAKRVSRSELTRVVAEARPDLIEAMEKAGEAYYRLEEFWQAQTARQQRAGGLPERDLESPYRRAMRETAKAVTDAFEALISDQNERTNRHGRKTL